MITWNTRAYVNKLAELLTVRAPGVRVEGLKPQRHPDSLRDGALVEVEIERFEGQATGIASTLDGELFGSLVVTRKASTEEAEAELFDLTLEIATVLQDLRGQGAIGPAQVLSVEPEPLEEPLQRRCVSWRISFVQQLRIVQAGQPGEGVPYSTLYGAGNGSEHERLVPRPQWTDELARRSPAAKRSSRASTRSSIHPEASD